MTRLLVLSQNGGRRTDEHHYHHPDRGYRLHHGRRQVPELGYNSDRRAWVAGVPVWHRFWRGHRQDHELVPEGQDLSLIHI